VLDSRFDLTAVRVKPERGAEITDRGEALSWRSIERPSLIERARLWVADNLGIEFLRPTVPLGDRIDVCSVTECPPSYDTISVNLSNFIDLLTDLSSPTSRVRQEPSSLSVVQIAGSKSLS
jgi:hypothetical protein